MLKKYYKDDKNLYLWQEDPHPPPEYELWDGTVGKILGILDSRQLSNRGKQYKCLLHGYSPFEYEWINISHLVHTKHLIKAFHAKQVADVKAAKLATKAKGKTQGPLIDDIDIQEMSDENVDEDQPILGKLKTNKHRKIAHIHRRR